MLIKNTVNKTTTNNLIMPTPPKESIGGTKGHHLVAFEFAKTEFEYLVALERIKNDSAFSELSDPEKTRIENEVKQRNLVYENLRLRVEDY